MKKYIITNFAFFSIFMTTHSWGQSILSFSDLKIHKLEQIVKSTDFEMFYTNDYLSNTGGEKAGPRNIGALDLYLTTEFKKFSTIDGEMMIHFTHIDGQNTNGAVGDTQGTSNIEMPVQIDRFTDLWYQHSWSPRVKSLFGLHDLSSEFNVTESTLNFINSAFGTSTEIALSGTAGSSLYPITSVGLRNSFQFTEEVKLLAAIYDANPGDETTYRSFHSDIGNTEGYMLISEASYETVTQKFAIGGWSHTNKVSKYLDESEKSTSSGTYAIYQRSLGPNVWAFLRYGWANPKVSMIQSNAVAGAVYRGIFQKKKFEDEIGIGASSAKFSGNHRKSEENFVSQGSPLAETVYEAYYQFKPMNNLQLRPDVQYIQNPTGLNNLNDAWSFGFRSVIQI